MLSLLAYVLINCIIFFFLRRKKYKVAAVAHAVLFGVLLLCLLFSGVVPDTVPLLNEILGKKIVLLMRQSLWGINGTYLLPILILEVATILLTVFACLITVAKFVHALSSRNNSVRNVHSGKHCRRVAFAVEHTSAKIFMLYCRYLC